MNLTCEICNGVFQSEDEIKIHFRRHKDRKFNCHLCEKMFFKISTLTKHLAVVHLKKKSFNWNKWKNDIIRLNKSDDTSAIEETTATKKSKSYVCKICNKEFPQLSSLKSHENFVHSNYQPYQCEVCSMRFKSNSNLVQHKKFHTKQKDYSCSICASTFYLNSHLKSHLRIHNNERKFECKECKKTFIHSSSLKKHQNFHNKIKNFHCKICEKSFTQSCHLREHERSHTERCFSCSFKDCFKKFKRLETLQNHLKTHTR